MRQEDALVLGLHPLGDDVQPQAAAEGDDGLGNGAIVRVLGDAAHEGLVDLELIQGQAFEVGQRGIAGAEIVHGEADANISEFPHGLDDQVHIPHHQALGQLQLEPAGIGPALVQRAAHLGDEIGLVKLAGADVDRQLQVTGGRVLAPEGESAAGGLQHPAADGDDESIFLGGRDEGGRRDHALSSRLPAQQGLGAGQAAVAIDLGLIKEQQFVLDQGAA